MAAHQSSGLTVALYAVKESFPETLEQAVKGPTNAGGGNHVIVESITSGKDPIVTLIDPAHHPSMVSGLDAATLGIPYSATSDKWATPHDGNIVHFVTRTGCGDVLDNRFFVIDSVGGTATAPTFRLIGADTTGKTFANDPQGKGEPTVFVHIVKQAYTGCLTSIDLSPAAPSEISIANFCDPAQTIPSTVQSGGTISIGGFAEQDGKVTLVSLVRGAEHYPGQSFLLAVHLPEVVGHPDTALGALQQASEPNYIGAQGAILAQVQVSDYKLDIPLDGVVGYSATFECMSPIRHQFLHS